MRPILVRNKNALTELMLGGLRFERIVVAEGLRPDRVAREILRIARQRGIRIDRAPRRAMPKRRRGDGCEGLVGHWLPPCMPSLGELLSDLCRRRRRPFLLLLNRVGYANNIGVIARTAFAAGVNGLIFQGREEDFLNEDTLHFSTGAIARLPLVRANVFQALRELDDEGVTTYSVEAGAASYLMEDLSGPAAFVMGAEARGVSNTLSSRCSKRLGIPMQPGIDSLNVGVSASLIMYEKVRQERDGPPQRTGERPRSRPSGSDDAPRCAADPRQTK